VTTNTEREAERRREKQRKAAEKKRAEEAKRAWAKGGHLHAGQDEP
jgi:hypothetical protein